MINTKRATLPVRLFGSYDIGFVKRQLCIIVAAASMTSLRGRRVFEIRRPPAVPEALRCFKVLYICEFCSTRLTLKVDVRNVAVIRVYIFLFVKWLFIWYGMLSVMCASHFIKWLLIRFKYLSLFF